MKIKVPWDTKSFIILLVLSFFLISSFALINAPSPFEWVIIDLLKIDTYNYGILVSICSWASLLDVIHGYLLDRYLSLVLATWIYTVLIIIGCAVYCVAGFSETFWLMILGRVIFGLGVNPLVLLANKHIIIWFGKGRYVNFVYSFCESIFWLGSSIVFLVSVRIMNAIAKNVSKDKAFAITNAGEIIFFAIFTIVPMLIAAYMHKYKKEDETPLNKSNEEENNKSDTTNNTNNTGQKEKKELTFSDYVCMPFVFWAFAISAFLYYVSILSFISMSVLFFKVKYEISDNEASTLSGVISIMPAVLSPVCGLVLDKIGYNLTSFTLAIALNVLSLGLFLWTSLPPLVAVIAMGFSLIVSSGMWSQFQFLVEEHQYMIAYGVAQTGLNGAQAVGTMIAGLIIDKYGYDGFLVFQFTVIVCAIPTIATVWMLDYRKDFFLNKTSKVKNELLGRTVIERSETEKNAEHQTQKANSSGTITA